jgi:hypothetical protein
MAELLYQDDGFEVRLESSHSIEHQKLLFFHSNEFINRDKESSPLFFNLYADGKSLASIVFEVVDQEAISLPQSPFGGVITGEPINEELMISLLTIVKKFFQNKQQKIHITTYPDSYKAPNNRINTVFITLGFQTSCSNINQHIVIDQDKLSTKMNNSRIKQLNLCIDSGYQFKKLKPSFLEQSYGLIEECLKVKGYPLTMSLNNLKEMFNTFPDRYLIFGVFEKNIIIATAISVNVNDKILYNFYHGDNLNNRQHSPMTLLISGIYAYCQQENFEVLDLGISTDQGVLNEGLFYFKRSCGAVSSDKISYELKA